jgi:hypothetical protein
MGPESVSGRDLALRLAKKADILARSEDWAGGLENRAKLDCFAVAEAVNKLPCLTTHFLIPWA